MTVGNVDHKPSLLTDLDLYLFNEGTHARLYDKLGAHPAVVDGLTGTFFAVWAPASKKVHVMGDFNGWSKTKHALKPRASSGIWEGFVPGVGQGAVYKYWIQSSHGGFKAEKADPVGFRQEEPPRTASVVWDLGYEWGDADWMKSRARRNAIGAPLSIYEAHLGSWRRVPEQGDRALTYREIAPLLADHVKKLGFTHVELLPVMEHPFYGSWGYQTTGYYAPTARYGNPQDFMFLVDFLHREGVGVILDWVPSHFPTDGHGPAYFDGTHLYEHADPRQGFHPDWKSSIFNYSRNEVRAFLTSNALFWLDKFHADGLRVDAVASMLYLDYSRKEGEWIPNRFGGRENLEAIDFLKKLNETVYLHHPDAQMIAEESTAWGGVSRPTYAGGLGFGLKWDMGWMHDTLSYMRKDPVHRRYHQNEITFRAIYQFHENFVMPLSHDEVVHGKGSLIDQMPGDDWRKFANLRLLYAWQWAMPGKKLLFMGCEFGQRQEWSHERSLDWHLLDYEPHKGLMRWVSRLNRVYRSESALYERDCDPSGFEWVDAADADNSVLSFLRKGSDPAETVLCVFNFTPVPRPDYRVGVPAPGWWQELADSDASEFGGSGVTLGGGVQADKEPWHGRQWSVKLQLPPLAAVFLKVAVR
ncbi:MAG: 1,4-alpha-glucan branching enzyme [Elusimicrobia bacterium RBG_16_66_12]|nr:MAG: 1,4-alpha-glucan branching enzyme [Elusimicrobia bacterium RBG_16_66_12]